MKVVIEGYIQSRWPDDWSFTSPLFPDHKIQAENLYIQPADKYKQGNFLCDLFSNFIDKFGSMVTVCYYITDKECSLEDAQKDFFKKLYGEVDSEFNAIYSDITGYLYTDAKLIIGGHDLAEELSDKEGKYIIMLVDFER